jgi:hypothetical protein
MPDVETLDRYADRRRHLRKPVNWSAELTLRTGEEFYDCTVIDESDGGVQVELAEEIDLPDEVVIRFSDHASQLVRRCWSLGTRVGYQFIDPAPALRRADQDVPPPEREAELAQATIGDFACITHEALGLRRKEMAFEYPAERIHALLRSRKETSLFEYSARPDSDFAASQLSPRDADAKTFVTL